MKKALSLILALALCLSLCACGAKQNNTLLISAYQKRIAELEELLAARDAEISRLLAAAENKESENTTPGNNETETKIPENSVPQYTTIELTLENWDTYFEVTVTPVFHQNGFGEYDDFDLWYGFQLKDEYYSLLDAGNSRIAMEISYNWGERICTVNFENQTYELGERVRTSSATKIVDTFINSGQSFYCSPFGIMLYDNGTVRYYEDVEMLRIQGSLCLQVQ